MNALGAAVLIGLCLSIGWVVRGNFGHEYGDWQLRASVLYWMASDWMDALALPAYILAIYGEQHAGFQKWFGPDAMWRTTPPLKRQRHR